MNTHSAMAMATQRHAEDLGRAGRRALASEATPRQGLSFRRLLRLRRAPLPGVVRAPQGGRQQLASIPLILNSVLESPRQGADTARK
jgi:hypothetical protein